MVLDMLQWHRMLNDKNIMLIYSGPLWSEGIGGIAGAIEKRMEFDEMPQETSQKVFSVFVEQMNNMLMYSAEKEKFEHTDDSHELSPKGTFVLGVLRETGSCGAAEQNSRNKKSKTYFIQTGNVMKHSSMEPVKKRIDYLNTLDKKELRKYYKEQMHIEDTNTDSKGSGLGFIEIARRISSKIVYSFSPYNEGFVFFTLYVTIGGEDE